MIFNLIADEIKSNFLDDDGKQEYMLHCSEAFYQSMYQSFQKTGFQIPAEIIEFDIKNPNIPANYTGFQFPGVALIHVLRDLEMGYKIEKYN